MPRFDVTAFGEALLRLSVPTGARLQTAARFDAHLGGAEANALAALASLGRRCSWLSGLPEGELGTYALRALAAAGIDTGAVVRNPARLGNLFLENAVAPRPVKVIYDRADSAITQLTASDIDWDYLLDTHVVHLTGITPALSDSCHQIVMEAAERARGQGVTVSFDVNYRSKLWSPEGAAAALEPLLEHVDILICGAADARSVFGVEGTPRAILGHLQQLCPGDHIVLTQGAEGASTLVADELVHIPARPAEVVDRLGAGDAFAAGVLDGFLDGDLVAGMQRGAVLGALALTQDGDMIATSRGELNDLLADTETRVDR